MKGQCGPAGRVGSLATAPPGRGREGTSAPGEKGGLPLVLWLMGVYQGHAQGNSASVSERLAPWRSPGPSLLRGPECVPLPALPSLQPQQCQHPPATWRSSSVPTAAVSLTSTTVMAMTTVETGPTSLTAVSTLASGVEEGRPGWEELLGEAGVRPGCQLGQELRRGASRVPGSLRGQHGGAGAPGL